MKKRLIFLLFAGLLNLNLFSQFFFIPIIIPNTTQYFHYTCPSRNKIANEYMQKGFDNFNNNINASIGYFKAAIKADSLFCDAYYNLTICFRKIKEYDSAYKYIDASLKVNATVFWARKLKGFIYMDKDDYSSAASYFSGLSRQEPEECVWLYYLSRSLIEINQLDSAQKLILHMQYLMKVQGYEKSQSIGLYLQAKIACIEGRYDSANRAYELIQEDYRNDAEYCYYYGICLLNIDKPDINKSKRYIKKAIRLGYNKIDQDVQQRLNI